MQYGLDDTEPEAADAYIFDTASVIGAVELGQQVSVWPGASIRADSNVIRVGDRSNVQDNAVIHVSSEHPVRIGTGVTVGHNATVHGCTVADDVLIGMGATVLSGAEIGSDSIVAAGTLVPEGTTIPPESVVMGVPGEVVRDATAQEQEYIRENAAEYVAKAQRYRDGCTPALE